LILNEDIVRVLRVVEYVGTREWVEETVKRSLHGTRVVEGYGTITAATLGAFPEVLTRAKEVNQDEVKDVSATGSKSTGQVQ